MQQKDHIHGFDYGRGIFSIFVVFWHTHAMGLPDVWSATASSPYRPTVLDFANFSVLLTAVPFFIMTSCYLYVSQGGGWTRLAARAKRLVTLAAFWSISYVVFASGYKGLGGLLESLKTMPVRSVVFAFGTVFYFFSALAITLAVCEVLRRTRGLATWGIFCLACALVPAMHWLALKHGAPASAAYWNPFNFFPYAAAAVLLHRYFGKVHRYGIPMVIAFSSLALATVCAEWASINAVGFTQGDPSAMPPYTRLSLLWTTIAVTIALLGVQRPAGRIIAAMSRNSLALYCAHPFVILLLIERTPNAAILGIATVAISYITISVVLRPTLSPRLVS